MKFAELDSIARRAARSSGDLRDDARQEAWVKFLTYPPQTRAYAWRSANSARNTLWRKERTQRRLVSAAASGIPLLRRKPLALWRKWFRE